MRLMKEREKCTLPLCFLEFWTSLKPITGQSCKFREHSKMPVLPVVTNSSSTSDLVFLIILCDEVVIHLQEEV